MPTLAAILLNFLMALSPLSCSVCDSIKDCYHDAAPLRDASTPTLNTTAAEIYYFHPDHLGSSAWITDSLGVAVQHLCYLPWGEPYVTQKTGNFNPTYTFSGKERDEETGYSYFGQRFYDSQLSIWISVDPMRGKYPSLTPYNYCANNPIVLVDPNGETIYLFDENGKYKDKIEQDGEHIGIIAAKEKEGTPIVFKFADPINDPISIEKGEIKYAYIVSNETINDILSRSGVFNFYNHIFKNYYILNQSNGSRNNKSGLMDYTTDAKIDDKASKGLSPYVLFVVKVEDEYTGHNNHNFGNFLWGAGASALGFHKLKAKLGAHINNFLFDENNRKFKWNEFYKRSFDSKDDQYSIEQGFKWMEENRK